MSSAVPSYRLLADGRLDLPEVTLVAVSSMALSATVRALQRSLAQVRPAEAILLSDIRPPERVLDGIKYVKTKKMENRQSYSNFILKSLANYIETEFALCIQWDGYILDAQTWSDEFLTVDYVGAPWPQFDDGHDVGNGGFSLRSRRLLQACADDRVSGSEAEDIAICRSSRPLLEREYGIRFADRVLARKFAFERSPRRGNEFGFHGVFNMAGLMTAQEYRETIASLDPGLLRRSDMHELLRQAVIRCDFKAAWQMLKALRPKADANIPLAKVAGQKRGPLGPRHRKTL
jgi:hypothetical protein